MPKVILTLAIPTIISMLVTSLYNIVTTFYVGQISTQATAAVGVSFSFMSIIQAIGFMFGQGSGNYISRELGAKDKDNACRMSATGFIYSVSFGIIIAILGLTFLTPLSKVLGSTPTILPDTERYMTFVLLGAPFMCGALVLNNQMRFQGNARYAMFGIITGAVVNVVLAPIFIFILKWGITGAGLATFLGQAFSLTVLMLMTHRGGSIRINPRLFSPTKYYIKEILAGGTPSLTRQALAAISVAMLNIAASRYGDAAIAAMSIVSRIIFVVFAAVIGLGHGFQPLCGFCYGAHLYDRVKSGYWFIVKVGAIFLITVTLLGTIFAEGSIAVFRNDPEVIRIGQEALKWQLITLPVGSFVMYTNMMMQTIRQPLLANILASARNGICFIPLIIILPYFFGLLGVEMCQAWADVLAFILAIFVACKGFKALKE